MSFQIIKHQKKSKELDTIIIPLLKKKNDHLTFELEKTSNLISMMLKNDLSFENRAIRYKTIMMSLLKKKNELLTNKLEETSNMIFEIIKNDSIYDDISRQNKKNSLTKKTRHSNLHHEQKINQGYFKRVKKISKRESVIIIAACTVILFVPMLLLTEWEEEAFELKTNYLIQNLRGDKISTTQYWIVPEGKPIYVNIVNSELISKEKIQIIRNAILSEENIFVDDSRLHKGPQGSTSVLYLGWKGALEQASQTETKFNIPTRFEVIESTPRLEGDIIISLNSLINTDGYSGYTKSTIDGNQILKSFITIYQADTLSDAELSSIIRHEFGHAMGLAHSTAPEDLMYGIISTNYPYVSECNVDAIISLYDGNAGEKTTCQK